MTADAPTIPEVGGFLGGVHGMAVAELRPLDGGFWSSAFSYRVADRELILRLSALREGFEMDRAAMAFARPDLPVPEVLDIGEAFGQWYAISLRRHGRFLETVRPDDAAAAGQAIERTLAALRAVPAEPDVPTEWYPETSRTHGSTWRRWLIEGLADDPARRVNGWRKTLASDARLDRVFRGCERRVGELLDACPERRDLVHGDLLNKNVLIAEDSSRITAVFSWKCSVRGDFLFDVAWCTFWAPWHPGIAAIDLWNRTLNSPSLSEQALDAAPLRHHCYEVQIGAVHLAWNAWTDNRDELLAVADHTEHVLARGPLEQHTLTR